MALMCEICKSELSRRVLGASELLECCRCGHLRRDLDAAPAFHRDHAYGGDPALDRARLALTHRTLTHDGSPSSVFEIGFGTGAMLRKFLDAGSEISGADPDQLQLDVDEIVRERGQLFTCGVEDVAPHTVNVDLVFGIHVLEHVVDPLKTLQVAASLANPGGSLQFLTPAGDWDGLKLFSDGWWMLEDPTHIRFFTAESLRLVAEKAGLVDIEIRRPLLDSLSTDAASAVRRLRPKPRPSGVLGERSTMLAAAASAPVVIGARALVPRMRPTLQLVAKVRAS